MCDLGQEEGHIKGVYGGGGYMGLHRVKAGFQREESDGGLKEKIGPMEGEGGLGRGSRAERRKGGVGEGQGSRGGKWITAQTWWP